MRSDEQSNRSEMCSKIKGRGARRLRSMSAQGVRSENRSTKKNRACRENSQATDCKTHLAACQTSLYADRRLRISSLEFQAFLSSLLL